ncbi:MAG: YggS family pyridoxal phosphate-dependent enzyme [Sphingobacteriia bacterium]|nr:YggS family pyridoxal phosphate-dependent enzyme [Sphingobacteriia bacterium]
MQLQNIKNKIPSNVKLIAVTKGRAFNEINPLLKGGQLDFGENRVEEATNKWSDVKLLYHDLTLHMIGKLQNKKMKDIVQIFDVIHSVESTKNLDLLQKFAELYNKNIKIFLQINLGKEPQKSGIDESSIEELINYCKTKQNIQLLGLMILPPINEPPKPYFIKLSNLAKKYNLTNLSMGMSEDYEEAISCGATHIRLGKILFE